MYNKARGRLLVSRAETIVCVSQNSAFDVKSHDRPDEEVFVADLESELGCSTVSVTPVEE
jgi:hypothetical protein